MAKCTTCDGSGMRVYPDTTRGRGGVGGQMISDGTCDACNGSGTERYRCPDCNGTGGAATLNVCPRCKGYGDIIRPGSTPSGGAAE